MEKLKQSPIAALLQQQAVIEEDKKEKKEKNQKKKEKKENRGRGGTKQKLIYLPEEMLKALNLKAVREVKSQSDVVMQALQGYLAKEIEEVKTW